MADGAGTCKHRRKVGVKAPKLTAQIAKILDRYPDGGQILKELIQNADDAKASEVKFMLDRNSYPKKGLLAPGLVDFQGPALYAWNNAMFSDEDWKHIGDMYSGTKERDPLKVGRFGLGFMSVFHMTDLPIIISGETVGILDPHKKYITPGETGTDMLISEFMEYPGHAMCFDNIKGLGFKSSLKEYQGSLFRFPLRTQEVNSEISKSPYHLKDVLDLYDSFFKEAPIILLFLKHVLEISLYDGSDLLYKVAINPTQRQMVASERLACEECYSKPGKYVLRVYCTTVRVHKRGTEEEYHWLIMNLIGQQTTLSQDLKLLPWVGIAAPLPGPMSVSDLNIEEDSIDNVMQALATRHIQKRFSSLHTSRDWTGNAVGHSKGHVFCFLPLPCNTYLPINIHGYFAVSDNRRTICWPSDDDKSKNAQWNKFLVQILIPPAYSVLLTIRSYLVSYNGTPLPLPSTEGDVTDPYAAWPLYSVVKNNEIWIELLKPTLNRVSSERILWTAAEKGRWVTPTEAVFLPAAKSSSAIPEVAIKVLIKAGVPVVSLPGSVRETLQHVHSLLLSQNVVTPARVRESLRSSQVQDLIKEITADIDETQSLLVYILSDVNRRNSHELSGIKLLPLATDKCTNFSNFPNGTNEVYVLKSAQTESMLIKCLPGMEDRFVNPCLNLDLTKLLLSLAKSKCAQLRRWEQSACDFRSLLSLSLSTWSNYSRPGKSVIWNPGRDCHPPISWLENLWQYLYKSFSKLSKFEGLPIVPMETTQVARIEHVTLVPLPEPTSRRYSNGYFFRSSSAIVGVLSKLSAKVVSPNQFVLNHRDICSYISDINILTILSFLANCQDKIAEVLNENDKSELRKEIARSFYELVDREQYSWARNVVKALPIFVVGVGSTKARMVALDVPCEIDGQLPVLPSQYTKFDSSLCYPPNILSQKEQSVVSLIHSLGQDEVPFDELCCDHLIPFALSQCKQCRKWCNGDDVFVWILNNLTTSYSSSAIIKCLRSTPFVRTNTEQNVLVRPCELYSSEKHFQILFNVKKDRKFAYIKYKEKGICDKLELCGLQTWTRIKTNHVELTKLLRERAKSVVSENQVSNDSALQRSRFIIKLAAKYDLMGSLRETRFLFSQATPPVSFPSGLKWFGKTDKTLQAPEDICVSECAYLVGSVIPVLRSDYSLTDSIKLFFHQPTVNEVIRQLKGLVVIRVKGCHKEITAMVEKIYDFLSNHAGKFTPMALPHNWIWCTGESTSTFRPVSQFVIQSPLNLSPFLYSIDLDHFLSKYKDMFRKLGVQDYVEDSNMVDILADLGQTHSQLTKDQLELAKGILKCLHDRKYNISQGDVLMLTAEETLKPTMECVYDDRAWVKQKAANISHHFTFVHVDIPLNQAMQFGAVPLSHKVAPSKRLTIKAGPHESITRRIKGIVDDYGGKIDIFKELIQNADDAKATQVKFVIDWREHGKQQLLTEELGSWQGPALLAYNNAIFSDEDLVNICKVAGETKLKDPMKTGRFGLGFCSTYYLTDVPSFVSQRYFTMFDPHTWYLKDRVSHNEPGIRIDLVDSREDLQVYKDQFVPFDGLFGCKIFQLEQRGFPGTIFRFPFRRSRNSDICYKCDFENDIEYLLRNFQHDFSSILIFLKNVKQVEVFVLDKAARQPLDMKQLCSVTKQSENISSRMNMILHHSSCPQPTSSSCVIEFNQSAPKQSHSSHQYVIASALSSEARRTKNQPGMIPLAEIAVEVLEEGHLLIPKLLENAHMFCFLPLPIESHLPFHINGFFDVGKDRRHLTDAQDSFGSEWNCALVKGGVPLALECLINHLAEKLSLQGIEVEKRHDVLWKYYRLWLGSREYSKSGKLTNSIVDSSKDCLAKSDKNILWCDMGGGRWVKPCKAYLVFDAKLHKDTKVEGQVVTLLLQKNYPVLPLSTPHGIKYLLKDQLGRLDRLFTYKKFFSEVFIPNIQSIDAAVRIDQLVFALKTYYATRVDNSSEFAWLKNILVSTECIPTQSTKVLVRPEQLIDPGQHYLASLYSPEEGRFPDEAFIKDRMTGMMSTLGEFGMITRCLPTCELVKRAKKFANEQSFNEISDQMKALFNYLLWFESTSTSFQAQPQEEQVNAHALLEVKFLKAVSCPSNVTLPWCSVQHLFSPSQVYSPEHLHLVFTQKPIVDFPDEQKYRLLKCLGISTNKPDISTVLEHAIKLIKYLCEQGTTSIDADTCTYLNGVFQSIYKYLAAHCSEEEDIDKIKEHLADLKWIWQNDQLYSSNQVVIKWDYESSSYLCKLSVFNSTRIHLFELLGVQKEATIDCLLKVLKQVKHEFHEKPLSDDVMKFIVILVRELYYKHSPSKQQQYVDILLPDENAVLRPASQMTCDSNLKGEWVEKLPVFEEFLENGGYFLHKDIPREHGLTLGAKPIIDALLKEIEDDTFLDGTDFGQEENLVDRLNSILKKYSDDVAIFREFVQNAEDAQASELVFVLDHRDDFPDQALFRDNHRWRQFQKAPALCIFNNQPFSEKDLQGICQLGRGGKSFSDETIGRFGIGFNVAYHLTDCPMFVTYDAAGTPTNFCMFDPLRHYLNVSVRQKPGRRWKVTNQHIHQFSDQFQPFLNDKFSKLRSLAPHCLQELSHGYVVFRLPLVRKSQAFDGERASSLCNGISKSLSIIEELFKDLKDSTAKESLLFLSHLKSISCFQISRDGECFHNFTSTVESASSCLSSSGTYQLTAKFTETRKMYRGNQSTNSESKWLIHKQKGFKSGHSALLEKASNEGLKPTGGVAALLGCPSQTGSLFCFLPMSSPSGVPVHLNAHFLVDDSRKHLTTVKGLEQWNPTIGSEILVPSYVELILSARGHVTGSQESIKWFYGLFPDLNSLSALDQLSIGTGLYQSLLTLNCPVLVYLRSLDKRNGLKWLCPLASSSVGQAHFCKSYYSESRQIQVDDNLKDAFLSLGIPITCAPDYIFDSFCEVSPQYGQESGLVTPKRVLDHLKQINPMTEACETVIKQNCRRLLKFCIQGVNSGSIKSLLTGAPLLLSMAETLETSGSLFRSYFSSLLPHCQQLFINPNLTGSDTGLSHRLVEAGVICPLEIKVVADNIQLQRIVDCTCVRLMLSECKTIELFWKYMNSRLVSHAGTICTEINAHFLHHPILPALNGLYYPPRLGKCVFKRGHDSDDMVLSAIKKLGYAELNEAIIGDAIVNISSLVASSHTSKDVIECLTLKNPTYNVSFTPAEVYAFTHVLSQAGTISNKEVLCHLQSLPLFQAIDGSFTSLTGKAVHIISSDVPTAGLSTLCKDACLVVLKDPGFFIGEFYKRVITDYERAICDASQFYCRCILPRVHCLSDNDLVEHLKYIRIHAQGSNSDWQKAVSILTQTPLIYVQKRNSRILVSELYDPENEFYKKFFGDKLLPVQWQTEEWLPFLRQLGLKTRVTEQEWLTKAIMSAKEAKQDANIELCKGKCATLLATLEEIIEYNTTFGITNDFEIFLRSASHINFIYCPAPPPLEQLIETVNGNKFKKSKHRMFTCFHESVSFKNRDLAGLSREILPESCQFVMEDRRISKALCVREPLAAKAVVKNLLELSTCLCSGGTAVMSSNIMIADAIKNLRAIFERHYEFLEKHESGEKSVDELLDTRCVLLSQDTSFVLVQPNQLVQHIPSPYDFQPFAYHVPPELRRFGKLLARLKVQEELTPLQYLQILANIKKEMDKSKSKLNDDQQYLRVCVDSFNALILCLRQHRPPLPDFSKMEYYLPSQEYVLMEARQLVFNDSPWIGSRLKMISTHQYKFILDPPPDKNGQLTPPSCLGVKSLSSIAVEIVHSDVDSRTNRCVDDELHRCQWAQALQTTFGSKEFFAKGLGRLFWHEHKKLPKSSKEFRSLAVLLHKCKIKCVRDIKTVIHVNNREVPGTEDTSKLCHFVTQTNSSGDQALLYITHHESLLEQLATDIIKFMKHSLKSESHIKAILDCKPCDIQKTLDRREVAPFDLSITTKNEGSQVGEKFEGCLSTKDFLLICNYSSDEMVIYQPMNTEERKYARVVNTNFRPGCDVTETLLELQTDASGNVNVQASVLEVYKILNTSQLAALYLSSTDHSFAIPVMLADVSCEESTRKNWLRSILHTSYPRKISTLCTLSQRLVVHLHYMLVTLKRCPEMFRNSVQELFEVLKSLPWIEDSDFKTCADQVEDVVSKVTGSPVQVQEPIHEAHVPTPVDSPFLLAPSAPSASSSIPLPHHVTNQPTPQRSVYTATSAAISTAGALPHYPHYPTSARSRFAQLVQAQSMGQNTRFPTMLATASTPTQPRPRPVDPDKAKMWLQQAKADLLAAHYLYSGVSHLPDQNETEGEMEEEIDEEEEEEETGHEEVSDEQSTCRFPALVCFLTHDVVEKCLKGVLFAKCGLPSLLQDSNLIVEMKEEVEKSSDVTQEFKQVARECTMLVNQHVAKSRYPNYQVPPCAPATVYTSLQASEALAAATKLMRNATQLAGIGELVGDLDNLPQTRLTTALSFMMPGQEVPSFWDEHSPGEEFKLVLLDPLEDEFSRISGLFLHSMLRCQIVRIDRIQNKLLWTKYRDRARQMYSYNDHVLGEESLFHGTSTHKPEEIYEGDASFDMRYCQRGMWGRGNYFAVNSLYSNRYAYMEGGVRQMLMAYVLTGHSYHCHPNGNLTQPPFRPSQGAGSVQRRYDSVCGVTGDSKVYITYDNDKAYPAYLITYECCLD